jgi:hypothetical protein
MRTVRLLPTTLALVLGAFGLALPAAQAAPGAGATPPDGTVTQLSQQVPNYFLQDPGQYCAQPGQPAKCSADTNLSVDLFADPINHLIFETDVAGAVSGCWTDAAPLLAIDSDTYQVQAYGCGGNRATYNGGPHTDSPLVAVDPADHLLFFTGSESDASSPGGTTPDTVKVVDETTLHLVATWTLPGTTAGGQSAGLPAPPTIMGLSWSAQQDDLTVLTGYDNNFGSIAGFSGPPPGVDVAVYSVPAAIRATSHGAAAISPVGASYPYAVPGCAYAMTLFSQFATADAYLSSRDDYLFVPCVAQGGVDGLGGGAAVSPPEVARLELTNLVPDGTQSLTALPGNEVGDFVFDPASDRAFVPVQMNSGTALYVYDGATSRLIGENAIVSEPPGETNPDFNCVDMALDPATGRVYGLAPTGLFFFDGRRTSIAGGQAFAGSGTPVQYQEDIVLPPDETYPYTRVVLNELVPPPGSNETFTEQSNPCTNGEPSRIVFPVFADRTPLSSDQVADSVDSNTFQGAIPPGSQVQAVFGANATSAGAHIDWQGSYGGAVNNVSDGSGVNGYALPLGSGSRDLLAGWVNQSSLSGQSPSAAATPLGDGTGSTATGIGQCTDAGEPSGCNPNLPDAPGAPTTRQEWPFQTAACPVPGSPPAQSADGAYVTVGYSSDGVPQEQQVPGSTEWAAAEVNCVPKFPAGGVTASASVQGLDSGTAGSAGVEVAQVLSSTSEAPGGASSAATSTATATAAGVQIESGGATLSIGEITQSATASATGRAGGARASRTVTISNVTVTPPGQQPQLLCSSQCTQGLQQLATEINQTLPAYLSVQFPEPDSPFGPLTSSGDTEQVPGSPGGYEALVQPPPGVQATNASVLGMPASDGEATLLPALRITLTPPAAANYELDYLTVDLAPVEADAEQGVSVSCPAGTYAPDPAEPLDCVRFQATGGSGPGSPTAPSTPGSPARYVAGSPGYFVPGTNGSSASFVPATLTTPSGQAVPQAVVAPAVPTLFTAPGEWIKRVFAGFRLLARSPAAAAEFFGFLCLLAAPAVLAIRRRRWQRAISDG